MSQYVKNKRWRIRKIWYASTKEDWTGGFVKFVLNGLKSVRAIKRKLQYISGK